MPIPEAFCPRFHQAAELVGRRWTGAVIRALIHDVCRFSDLLQTIPGISARMLSERLKELESEGVLRKSEAGYQLTEKGRALVPVVEALTTWAEDWLPKPRKRRAS
jgi:DNA-binding HxlR family transcriptional regulator